MLILILISTFIACAIGMITGFGTSTIMMPTMLFFFPLHQALIFVGIIHLFHNVIRIIFTYKSANFKFLIWLLAPAILFSFLGAKLTYSLDQRLILQTFGFLFLFYSILLFYNPHLQIKADEKAAFFGGSLSGFVSGLTGIGGAIRALFLSIFNLPKLEYIFALSILGAITDVTRVITYLHKTHLEKNLWLIILISLPISFFGVWIGKNILNIIPQKKFRLAIGSFLALIALMFIFKTDYFID